ncbi:MAG: HDOD domain-containing protein [Candidatus Hydrogenedentes bacterium]|nr:HDOD domain-containing protein [Candidatus Hydrogenedentota bacterium]
MGSTRVGALLLEENLIDSVQLQRALEHQEHRGGRTMGILVELGMIDHDQVYKFLATRGVPAINPMHCNVQQHVVDLLPRDFVVEHEMIPVDRLGRLLTVAMVYPFDIEAIAQAEAATGLRIKPMLCRAKEFLEAARRLYPNEYDLCGTSQPHQAAKWISSRRVQRTNEQLTRHTITRIHELQTLPVTKHTKGRFALLDAAQGLNVDRAAEILSRDPIALARVLAEANSREWTKRRPILCRREAIQRLGMRGVVEALESLDSWESQLRSVEAAFTQWRATAVAVAETAASIAKNYALAGAPGIYEAALLHNLGSLALLVLDTANYASVYAIQPLERRHTRELELYGVTDSEAGAELASAWNLPEPIITTIRYLLDPESAPSSHDTVAVTALAHHIVQMERNLETECSEALRILGLTKSTLRTTILRLHANSHADAVEI